MSLILCLNNVVASIAIFKLLLKISILVEHKAKLVGHVPHLGYAIVFVVVQILEKWCVSVKYVDGGYHRTHNMIC